MVTWNNAHSVQSYKLNKVTGERVDTDLVMITGTRRDGLTFDGQAACLCKVIESE